AQTKAMVRRPENFWRSSIVAGSADQPVVYITLADIQAFCNWLSRREGRNYVVPTEMQWEYACRAGTTTAWYCGDDQAKAEEIAWISRNLPNNRVALKPANPFGLFDMHGNVEEICLDSNGRGVIRSGSRVVGAIHCRSASRFTVEKDDQFA